MMTKNQKKLSRSDEYYPLPLMDLAHFAFYLLNSLFVRAETPNIQGIRSKRSCYQVFLFPLRNSFRFFQEQAVLFKKKKKWIKRKHLFLVPCQMWAVSPTRHGPGDAAWIFSPRGLTYCGFVGTDYFITRYRLYTVTTHLLCIIDHLTN